MPGVNRYDGFDVNFADALGKALGVKIVFQDHARALGIAQDQFSRQAHQEGRRTLPGDFDRSQRVGRPRCARSADVLGTARWEVMVREGDGPALAGGDREVPEMEVGEAGRAETPPDVGPDLQANLLGQEDGSGECGKDPTKGQGAHPGGWSFVAQVGIGNTNRAWGAGSIPRVFQSRGGFPGSPPVPEESGGKKPFLGLQMLKIKIGPRINKCMALRDHKFGVMASRKPAWIPPCPLRKRGAGRAHPWARPGTPGTGGPSCP